MSATQKLTKKQKKGIAFRNRKTGKGKEKDAAHSGMEDNDVPILENQDLADMDGLEVENKESKPAKEAKERTDGKRKEKAKEDPVDLATVPSKKRKREKGLDDLEKTETSSASPPKKKKGLLGDPREASSISEGEGGKLQRFILFVGNLKYTTTLDEIKAHFSACDPPPSIRLLTPKPSSKTPTRPKSKGCAFLEFSHRNALQQALKLHQSQLDGRMINSEKRVSKLKERNKELYDQRKQRVERESKEGNFPTNFSERPQRYSATSGIEQVPLKTRTWTVGDEGGGPTHRGGKKHSKDSRRPKSHDWGRE
ncbi:hypothetical protein BD779DRAFT_1486365 [Infundibulicybe gibba]|nr:hypothetical protein BD779DRAFT_1486365 [Infundibulicybe gibba]